MNRARAASTAVAIIAFSTPGLAGDPKTVTIDGSSTVFPISEARKAAGITFFELPIAFDALTVVVNP